MPKKNLFFVVYGHSPDGKEALDYCRNRPSALVRQRWHKQSLIYNKITIKQEQHHKFVFEGR